MNQPEQLDYGAIIARINTLDSQFDTLQHLANRKFSELLGVQNELNRIAAEIDTLVERLED